MTTPPLFVELFLGINFVYLFAGWLTLGLMYLGWLEPLDAHPGRHRPGAGRFERTAADAVYAAPESPIVRRPAPGARAYARLAAAPSKLDAARKSVTRRAVALTRRHDDAT